MTEKPEDLAPDAPALANDTNVMRLFHKIAAACGMTLPKDGWCRASLVADVASSDVKFVVEVPATIGAIDALLGASK